MDYYATMGVFQLREKYKIVEDSTGKGHTQYLPISEGFRLVSCVAVGIGVYDTDTLAYIDNNWSCENRDIELHSPIKIRLCKKFFDRVKTAKDLACIEYLTECAEKLIKNDATDWGEMEKYSQY